MLPEPHDIVPRRRLLAFVRAHPGAHLREIERGARLALGVLRHHLDFLVGEGLVREERDGRLRRFFPVGLEPDVRSALPALRVRSHRAVVLYLLNHPGASTRDVSEGIRVPLRTASYYLRALVESGLVAREKTTYRLADPDRVVRALVVFKPSFADKLIDAALEIWFDQA